MLAQTEAIVLHARKHGDSSKIITSYTKDYGRLSLIAKGAMNPKSKFTASLEPLTHSEIVFYYKPNKDLFLLSKSETIKSNSKIKNSIDKLMPTLAMCELTSQATETLDNDPEIFDKLNNNIELAALPNNDAREIFLDYCLFMAEQTGFSFHINNDISKNINKFEKITISLDSGSLLESDNYSSNSINISSEAYIFLINALQGSRKDTLNSLLFNEISNFFKRYFSHHFERKFHFNYLSLLE